MNKDITEFPNSKQIEQILWSKLQEIFSKALKSLLEDMDQQIAEERDKKRFRLLDRRKLQIASLFDEIEVKRNYCFDRKTGEYVHLLDRYLKEQASPLMEEAAIELAIQGPAYRKAARTLETLLGYRVISHETIRKHLLEVSSIPKRVSVHQSALFVEVDGLYVKHQNGRIWMEKGAGAMFTE